MDAITFRYLVNLVVSEQLDMCLMDIVIACLYGILDNDMYMKIPEGFNMPEACKSNSKDIHSIKWQRLLYGFKHFG